MPHVVLTGKIDSNTAYPLLDNLFIKIDGGILKTTNHYIDKNKQAILVESLAIEKGKKIAFLAMINNRDDGVVIRIYPGFDDFEKTDGVKKILAELAKLLLSKIEDIQVGKTNLEDYLS